MDIRKLTALAAAAVMTASCAVSCKKKEKSDSTSRQAVTDTNGKIEDETVSTYPDYPISYPEIEEKTTGDLYEAEAAKLGKGLKVVSSPKEDSDSKGGKKSTDAEAVQPTTKFDPTVKPETLITNYSGDGYVKGFKNDGSTGVVFTVDAPSNQHYDLSFSIAADRFVNCDIFVNGTETAVFKTMSDGEFTLITLYGVFLTKGKSEIEIRPHGDISLDYLKMANNTSLRTIKYNAENDLSNKEAGVSAKELMDFLTDNYGKYVLMGQYASDENNEELDLIYRTTGKYPAIRFSALHTNSKTFDSAFRDIDACADWYHKGGIVGLMWYWEAPSKKKPSVYAKDTDFKLSDAMTDIDIAEMSQEEIRGLYGEGKISEQCYGLILDIDNMAGQLTSLKNKGVPVLWRPLHEGSGDWFWWGASGVDAYKWLWELMYRRYTNFFELDNLIWIWNGQSESSLVNKNTFDIAALDIYLDSSKDYGSRYEQFLALQNIVGKDKLIALSECSTVPDIDAAFRDNAVWSFFGLWYGKYISDDKGGYSEEYTSKDALVRAYNSDGALTLDEYIKLRSGEKLVPEYGDEKPASTTSSTSATTTDTTDTTGTSSAESTETTAVSAN
ncbi:MAG: glycoside hydrolase [Ruminococcus sp.]|nr:glycoside hydrolase [Ruminococcus sp.]